MRGEFGYRIPPAARASMESRSSLDSSTVSAFRYYWATEGLRAEDCEFRPGPSSMSAKERLQHVLNLPLMIQQCCEKPGRESFESDDVETLRAKTLEILGESAGAPRTHDDRAFAGTVSSSETGRAGRSGTS